MFNLTQEVNDWGATYQESHLLGEEEAQAQKSLLVSEIAELRESGLTEEEAFTIGRYRVDDGYKLEEETVQTSFSHLLRKSFLWLVSGYFLFSSIPLIMNIFFALVFLFEIKAVQTSLPLIIDGPYLVPLPIIVFALLTFLVTLFVLTSQRYTHLSNRISKWGSGLKLPIILGIGYLALNITNFYLAWQVFSTPSTSEVISYSYSVSGSLFSAFWQFCVLLVLIVLLVVQRRSQNRAVVA